MKGVMEIETIGATIGVEKIEWVAQWYSASYTLVELCFQIQI